MRSASERRMEADHNASRWLGLFNELEEAGKGHTKKAQDAYRKAEHWLAKLNQINGDA